MAWAALIPIAAQVLGSMGKKEEAPGPQMPPPPSLGEIFAANAKNAGGSPMTQFSSPQSNPFSPIPVGGGSRGSNG